MKILTALIILHCQNYLDYTSCFEAVDNCIDAKVGTIIYGDKSEFKNKFVLISPEEMKIAEAFNACIEDSE